MAEYYVYQPNQQHAGPMSADDVARAVVTRKIPEGAQYAAVGDTSWGPLEAFQELANAVKALSTAASPPPRPRMQTLAPGIPGPTSIPPRRNPTPAGMVIPQSPAIPMFPTVNSGVGPSQSVVTPLPVAKPEPQVILSEEVKRASMPNIDLGAIPPMPSADAVTAASAATPTPLPGPAQPLAGGAPAASPMPASLLATEVTAPQVVKEEKKDDKPKAPALDPKLKNLPFMIFGAFAIVALFEIIIAAATSSSPKHDPGATIGTVGKP